MNRIETCFQTRRAQGRKVLVGYLTAGDPDMAASEADIRAAVADGVDVLELGVPFSDPTADGPVIQAAAFRSLQAGTTTTTVLELVRRLRRDLASNEAAEEDELHAEENGKEQPVGKGFHALSGRF